MGAFGKADNGSLELVAFVGSMDGQQVLKAQESGPADSAEDIGRRLAEKLLAAGAESILREFRG
jgi:hydroxymethylbilane synthase